MHFEAWSFDLSENKVPVKAMPKMPLKMPEVPQKRRFEDIAKIASGPPSEASSVEETPAKKAQSSLPKVVGKSCLLHHQKKAEQVGLIWWIMTMSDLHRCLRKLPGVCLER